MEIKEYTQQALDLCKSLQGDTVEYVIMHNGFPVFSAGNSKFAHCRYHRPSFITFAEDGRPFVADNVLTAEIWQSIKKAQQA